MLVDYPHEWSKYMVDGKVRTFRNDTPTDIIKQAKEINDDIEKHFAKHYFHFEGENE